MITTYSQKYMFYPELRATRRWIQGDFWWKRLQYLSLIIWMFQSRRRNNKINNVHKKAPRIVYSDYQSTFQELLDKDAYFSVQRRNSRTLAIELYKHIYGLSPAVMGEVFKINRTLPFHLRTHMSFQQSS